MDMDGILRTIKECYDCDTGQFQENKNVYGLNGKRLGKMPYCGRFSVGADGFRCPRTGDVVKKPNPGAQPEKKYLCQPKEGNPWPED